MRTVTTMLTAGVLAAFLAVGCGDGASSSGGGGGGGEGGEVEAIEEIEEVDVPTQDEADLEAAESIDEENADAEFEALQREIEQDDG